MMVITSRMLMRDGTTATQSLPRSSKSLRGSQWDLVRPLWFDVDETAIGLAHPQPPIHSSILISEILSSRKASAFSLKIPNDDASPQ